MAEKMCPVVKAKWLEALRSGRYKQTKGLLKDIEGFCCLGVLSDIYAKEHDIEWNKPEGSQYFRLDYATSVLDVRVLEWAGVTSNDPEANSGQKLSEMNDNNVDFNEISTVIETDF